MTVEDLKQLIEKLTKEDNELEIKRNKLKYFIYSEVIYQIPLAHRYLLFMQEDMMLNYHNVLQLRINDLKNSLPVDEKEENK